MDELEKPASEFEEGEDEWSLRNAIFNESLGNVPRRANVIVPVTGSIFDALSAMNEKHTGCALIVRLGKLVGIFTERDVLRKVAGTTLDIHKTAVEQVMTPDPDTLPANASVAYALQKMAEEGYRHIPLVDEDGGPVGVVAVRDIVCWLVKLFPDTVINLPPQPGYPRTVEGG